MDNKEEKNIKKDTIGSDFLNSVIQDKDEKKALGLILEYKDPKRILEILLTDEE